MERWAYSSEAVLQAIGGVLAVLRAFSSVTIALHRPSCFRLTLKPGCRCRTTDRKAAIRDGDDLIDKCRRYFTAL
jgi:hypothetical protein